MNDSGGVYWRSGTSWTTPIKKSGYGVYPGTKISVSCYRLGTANVPGTKDKMWVEASWHSGPGTGHGWINEHFVNDGAPINKAAPGVPKCSTGATAAETAAVKWAEHYVGKSYDGSECLKFTYDAYLDSSGTNLWKWSKYPIASSTYPEQVWKSGFTHGTKGKGTPPYGALVFYDATSGHGIKYSHVALSVGGGKTVSTSDTYKSGVHYETLAQHASAHPYNAYVGWWLPDK